MKNLALLFCSIRPKQLNEEICDFREEEYVVSLQQFSRIIPKSFDVYICENTVDDLDSYKNSELKKLLKDSKLILVGKDNNVGTKNKGMGELVQLKFALDAIDTSPYENISYVTGRRFYTCPYVFERTESMSKSALLSNPDMSETQGLAFTDMLDEFFTPRIVAALDLGPKRYVDEIFSDVSKTFH